VFGIARFVGTRHVGRMTDVPMANAPGTRAYLPETAALPLSDERVATEVACTFVESIVGAIAGSNAEWRCWRRALRDRIC
jgi:hypothetical protein